ncbi:MAG TPA: hypothetical protein VFR19_13675 [Hyphomicrobiaceae bacterium]|nr:hypothetical protein [Hyphomicrobiaceae bacterium]
MHAQGLENDATAPAAEQRIGVLPHRASPLSERGGGLAVGASIAQLLAILFVPPRSMANLHIEPPWQPLRPGR